MLCRMKTCMSSTIGHHFSMRTISGHFAQKIRAVKNLPNSKLLELEIQDYRFDYNLMLPKQIEIRDRHSFLNRMLMSIAKRLPNKMSKKIIMHQVKNGYPYPQTLKTGALAQIQIVAEKI